MPIKNTKKIKSTLVKQYGQICVYCEKKFRFNSLTLDHKVPRCRGGSDKISNLALSCHDCNNKKDCLTFVEFVNLTKDEQKEILDSFPLSGEHEKWLDGRHDIWVGHYKLLKRSYNKLKNSQRKKTKRFLHRLDKMEENMKALEVKMKRKKRRYASRVKT